MNLIVIGDVHNHIQAAESIAQQHSHSNTIIFVGDYFDDFGDTAKDARDTAMWLKYSIHQPNRIHLLGNHDLSYHPICSTISASLYRCVGYSEAKDKAIAEILTPEDWEKMKLYHFENGWHFTHAGIHPKWFEHPVLGITDETIQESMKKVESDFNNREPNSILGAIGKCRGGMSSVGGIMWHDHNQESQPSKNIYQIYGHTPLSMGVDIHHASGGTNVCVDTGLSQVLEVESKYRIKPIQTTFKGFYPF